MLEKKIPVGSCDFCNAKSGNCAHGQMRGSQSCIDSVERYYLATPKQTESISGMIVGGETTYDDLMKLKDSREWWDKVITATTTKDVTMHVWNQRHPVEKNMTDHVCKAGTKVRIWMVSRFGDIGITDNLKDPCGYDVRVDLSIVKDIHIEGKSI